MKSKELKKDIKEYLRSKEIKASVKAYPGKAHVCFGAGQDIQDIQEVKGLIQDTGEKEGIKVTFSKLNSKSIPVKV